VLKPKYRTGAKRLNQPRLIVISKTKDFGWFSGFAPVLYLTLVFNTDAERGSEKKPQEGNMVMKLLLSILLLLPIATFAQKPQSPSPLKQMIETEQAFSKTAEVKNARDAFTEFIADDGLLFRPRAVNGKKWMKEHPVPPSDKHPLLAWQPAFAGMAKAGDLGFTTGPWEFKEDIKDAKPSGYGHFVTLWKKQQDGSWKFIVDLGISHPQSGGPLTIWQLAMNRNKSNSKLWTSRKPPNYYSNAIAPSLLKQSKIIPTRFWSMQRLM
jgi:ketosteroid isomerase-like protein